MKKVLLGTSAIALAGAFATTANAVEWEVKVGGYMEQYAAYATSDVDGLSGEEYDGVDSISDQEIHFLPSITLDNGIQIGANVQLEALTDGDQIDESFLFVDGSFGRVLMGSENSAGYLMTYGAPDVTFINVNSGSLPSFMPLTGTANNGTTAVGTGNQFFRGTLGSTFVENATNNDAHRFTYFTPRFAGFQVGVSYARDSLQDNVAYQNIDNRAFPFLDNIVDIGANYVNSFGAFDVAVSGRYGFASAQGPNPDVWGAGLNLGYAGFTIGGSYADQNDARWMDGEVWDAGVSYETGPWGFSFTYMNGENVDDENFFLGNTGSDEQLDQYLLGVSYTLAKGVALNGFGAYADLNEDDGDAGAGTSGNDVDGWVVGTGIKISF